MDTAIARTSTSHRELTLLAEHDAPSVRAIAVRNPHFPAHLLADYVCVPPAKFPELRYHAARNVNCPSETLATAASYGDAVLRRAVATNPNTPVGIVRALLKDEDEAVRRAAESMLRQPLGTWATREDRKPRERTIKAPEGKSHSERVEEAMQRFATAVQ